MEKMQRFSKFAWVVLAYNVLVVVWGAYVRASGAGAGCGDHWPDCNGQIVPVNGTLKTLIEFSHRSTSGIAGLLVVAMVFLAFRACPRGHLARRAAGASLIFMVIEALIGAILVKKRLVTDNDSAARAMAIAIHLVNTLLLLGALTLTAWWSRESALTLGKRQWFTNRKTSLLVGAIVLAVIFLNASGAITALGATLFPVTSLSEGLARGLSPKHFLESLIWVHPIAAVITVLAGSFVAIVVGLSNKHSGLSKLSRNQVILFGVQLLLGGLNFLLHAPTWLQLLHLMVADLTWINLIVFFEVASSRKEEGTARTEPEGYGEMAASVH